MACDERASGQTSSQAAGQLLPGASTPPRSASFWLSSLIISCAPLGAAYLWQRRQFSLFSSVVIAAYWSSCSCMLLLRPAGTRTKAVINVLGLATWCVRLGHAVYVCSMPPQQQLRPLLDGSSGYLLMIAKLVFQSVLTCSMQPRLHITLRIVYAVLITGMMLLYNPSISQAWWQPLMLLACTQACATAPYAALMWLARSCTQWRSAQQPHPQQQQQQHEAGSTERRFPTRSKLSDAGHDSVVDKAPDGAFVEPAVATRKGSMCSADDGVVLIAAGPDVVDDAHHSAGDAVTAPCPAAAAAAPASQREARLARSPASRPLKSSFVQACRSMPYQSRLRAEHKVCLKLDTQLSCSDLPPDLAQHMQQALCRIGVPALRITDLAVRPGCIMITLSMRDTKQEDSRTAASSADQPVIADISPKSLTQALLQELQHVCDMHKTEGGTSTDLACSRALLQVDKQLLSAVQQDSRWMLTPVDQELPGSKSAPWLGISVPVAAQIPMRSGSSVHDTAVLQLLLDVQMWGLTKLDEVEGWAPPALGHHDEACSSSRSSSNAASVSSSIDRASAGRCCSAWCSQAATSRVAAVTGRSMRLLVRVADQYVVTRVARVQRGQGNSCASVQVAIDLPLSSLVRHHPGGVPSSLVLLNLELWEGEVFLSSSPLISLPQAVTSEAGLNSSAWWLGASEGVVTAAMTEMEALACGLAIMDQDDSRANATASHVAFVEDVKTWLLGVQATAQACQHCTAAGQQGRQASSQLTPAALKLLGEGLQEYAASIGMHKLHAMLACQMQVVVKAEQQHNSPPGCRQALLQGVRDAVVGYSCSMCEARYKQHFSQQLVALQPVSSLTLALYGITSFVQVLSRVGSHGCLYFYGPWILLHMAGAAHSMLIRTRASASSQPGQAAASLRWTVPAYFLRLLLFALYSLLLVPTPEVSGRVLRMPVAWALTHLVFALVEQVQSSAVLPAKLISCVAMCVDLPCVLVRALREGGWWAERVLLAPLVVVGARLMMDTHMRRMLRQQAFLKMGGVGAHRKDARC